MAAMLPPKPGFIKVEPQQFYLQRKFSSISGHGLYLPGGMKTAVRQNVMMGLNQTVKGTGIVR